MQKSQYLAAVCQMDSQGDRQANLCRATELIRQAAAQGAELVALPELFSCIDAGQTAPEPVPQGPSISQMAPLAAELGIWLLCGSLHQAFQGKCYNTSVLLSPRGTVAASYSKLHMFDVTLPDGSSATESALVQPGGKIVVAGTELGRLGMSVCYDLRFPELYRLMTLAGAQLLMVPAEFNRYTGEKHWELLLRARAVENLCYVLAPAQTGVKQTRDGPYPCYGNSMIISPDGEVLARIPRGEGFAVAQIDLQLQEQLRQRLPVLKHRRRDIYTINGL